MFSILHIVNAFDIGGMENGLVNIINRRLTASIEHKICSFKASGKMAERIKTPGVQVFSLGNVNSDRTLFKRLAGLIHRVRPDIIHVRGWGPLFDTVLAVGLMQRKPKLVFSCHGMSFEEQRNMSWASRLLRAFLVRRTDMVITLNQVLRDHVSRLCFIGKDAIRVIGNGVETSFYVPAAHRSAERHELRKQLGLTSSHFLFGTVGRLDPIKNIAYLINHFGTVSQKFDNLFLLVVGDGPTLESLKERAENRGVKDRIIFLGARHDMPLIYNAMDAYVQTSLFEGFSNTLLEAMASGLPIVCSDVGGNGCLISHGHTGLLFDLAQPNDLVQHLYVVSTEPNLRLALGQNARKEAEEKWEICKSVEQYERAYRSLMLNTPTVLQEEILHR